MSEDPEEDFQLMNSYMEGLETLVSTHGYWAKHMPKRDIRWYWAMYANPHPNPNPNTNPNRNPNRNPKPKPNPKT